MGLVPVLVTTQHRGIFFGWANPNDLKDRSFWLERVKCAIYFHASVGGFLGLAKVGPNSECRIGTEAPKVLLHDVTSVTACSDEAVAAWIKA